MNQVTYVATPMNRLNSGNPFGATARVYVGSEWKFTIYKKNEYENMILVIMFTRMVEYNVKAVSLHMFPPCADETLRELAQVFPPF